MMTLLCQTVCLIITIVTCEGLRILHGERCASTYSFRPLLLMEESYLSAAISIIPSLYLYNQCTQLSEKVQKLGGSSNLVQCDSGEYTQLQENYNRLENSFNASVVVIDSFGNDMKGSLEAYNSLYQSVNQRVDDVIKNENKRAEFESELVKSIQLILQETELLKGQLVSVNTAAQTSISVEEVQQIKATLLDLEEKFRKIQSDSTKSVKGKDIGPLLMECDQVGVREEQLYDKVLYDKTVKDLRAMCKERGMTVKGTKAELIAKLS